MTTHLITAAIGDAYAARFKQKIDPRFREYARYWGMEYEAYTTWPDQFISKEDFDQKHKGIVWIQTIAMARKLEMVPEGDIVIWIDSDICIVRGDHDLSIQKDIGLAFDQPGGGFFKGPFLGPNSGLVVVRNNAFTRDFAWRCWNRNDCDPWPFSSNMGQNLTIGEYTKAEVFEHFEELPRYLNVTLDQYKSGVTEEQIRFKHFAGGEQWNDKYFQNRVIFK